MFNLIKSAFSKSYEDLNGNDFKKRFQASPVAVLLDVRTAGEFASGTIPGAKNMDILSPDFEKKIAALDKNKEYFVFCRSGNRSARACGMMASLGLKSYNLAGGVGEWRNYFF